MPKKAKIRPLGSLTRTNARAKAAAAGRSSRKLAARRAKYTRGLKGKAQATATKKLVKSTSGRRKKG